MALRILVLMSLLLGNLTMTSAEPYLLGPDSIPKDTVPKGSISKRIFSESQIYPETVTEFWIYVPAQYNDEQPACVMVFQDGEAYLDLGGEVRAPTVMDNLIHAGELPPMIGVFINPSQKKQPHDMREQQYVPMNNTYVRFLLEEILPIVNKDHTIVSSASGRAIIGMSDGALAAFSAAWHRPDAFSKVISHIGSYTRLKGGSEYPYLLRKTRGNPKPIRVFLQDGANDLNLLEGNWTLANIAMESALMFARYDYKFEMGTGGHTLQHGGAIFPDTLRWIWRDYPGVHRTEENLDLIKGDWNLTWNIYGYSVKVAMNIKEQDGALSATVVDEIDGELSVESVSFDDNVLSIKHQIASSHFQWMTKETGKPPESLSAWLKVHDDSLKGALAIGTESMYDFRVSGSRVRKP